MKKLKLLLVALCVIPLTLVLTACGGGTVCKEAHLKDHTCPPCNHEAAFVPPVAPIGKHAIFMGNMELIESDVAKGIAELKGELQQFPLPVGMLDTPEGLLTVLKTLEQEFADQYPSAWEKLTGAEPEDFANVDEIWEWLEQQVVACIVDQQTLSILEILEDGRVIFFSLVKAFLRDEKFKDVDFSIRFAMQGSAIAGVGVMIFPHLEEDSARIVSALTEIDSEIDSFDAFDQFALLMKLMPVVYFNGELRGGLFASS